ncbi:MAG: hypothetical protein GY845_14045 [Planctomycetes bacterium]|nr:hypothetical protein [Planctomycetota bacterium]
MNNKIIIQNTLVQKMNSINMVKIGLVLFLIMLVGRLIFVSYGSFYESDDIFIATGVGALVNDNIGDTYRYGPQLGYYRLVQLICIGLGGKVSLIPWIMITLSAFSGALIPLLGLFIFRKELSVLERILLMFFMYINPLLWTSSRYGNIAIVALLFCIASIVILSNKPRKAGEYCAVVLFGIAILIRADSVLVLPVIAWLTYLNHNSIKKMITIGMVAGSILIVIYGIIFLIDPRMDNIHSTVTTHLFNPAFRTMFWEYFIWSFSIFPIILAIMGLRELIVGRGRIFVCIMLWCLPVCLFYYGSTTTPRYFLLIVPPISLLSVIGLTRLVGVLVERYKPAIIWSILILLSSIHLFVGLGHFKPDSLKNVIKDAGFGTHDGIMYTGGFIYHGGILHQAIKTRSLSFQKFGYRDPWFTSIKKELNDKELLLGRERKIIVFLDGGRGGVGAWQFHFHAQAADAEYISRPITKPELAYGTETVFKIGNVTFVTFFSWAEAFKEIDHLDVGAGDEFWEIGNSAIDKINSKMPVGLSLVPIQSLTKGIKKYQFIQKIREE